MPRIAFLDTEVQANTGKMLDIGATNDKGAVFHSPSLNELAEFIASAPFICGPVESKRRRLFEPQRRAGPEIFSPHEGGNSKTSTTRIFPGSSEGDLPGILVLRRERQGISCGFG
ncbi:MAG: hypothetical protein WD577_09420 [Bacteroidales bacterium]